MNGNNVWAAASSNTATPYDFTTYTTGTTDTVMTNAGYFVLGAGVPAPAARPTKPEDPVQWLRRRVNEVLWIPA